MIDTDKLMEVLKTRVVIWQFQEIYANDKEAKRVAARLWADKIDYKGVVVKRTKENSYIVMYWRKQLPKMTKESTI